MSAAITELENAAALVTAGGQVTLTDLGRASFNRVRARVDQVTDYVFDLPAEDLAAAAGSWRPSARAPTACLPTRKGRHRASLVTVNEDPAILLTPPGRELLARLAAEPDAGSLAVAERLRREYPADLVATAMAQRELRLAAEAKFSRAARMLFTRACYEQSSSETIARYRACRASGTRAVSRTCAVALAAT